MSVFVDSFSLGQLIPPVEGPLVSSLDSISLAAGTLGT